MSSVWKVGQVGMRAKCPYAHQKECVTSCQAWSNKLMGCILVKSADAQGEFFGYRLQQLKKLEEDK